MNRNLVSCPMEIVQNTKHKLKQHLQHCQRIKYKVVPCHCLSMSFIYLENTLFELRLELSECNNQNIIERIRHYLFNCTAQVPLKENGSWKSQNKTQVLFIPRHNKKRGGEKGVGLFERQRGVGQGFFGLIWKNRVN